MIKPIFSKLCSTACAEMDVNPDSTIDLGKENAYAKEGTPSPAPSVTGN